MKKFKFRNISLKEALMKKNFPRSKSVNWKDKSNNETKNNENKKSRNNINNLKKDKNEINFY